MKTKTVVKSHLQYIAINTCGWTLVPELPGTGLNELVIGVLLFKEEDKETDRRKRQSK